jgi:RHS repeat-associated protein
MAITSDVGAGGGTILSMLSGVTSLSSPMTPSELNGSLAGKPHRGFQPRRTDLRRGRSRRRPRTHRAFESPTYEVTSNRWDQQNRLVRELHGTHESVYEYDGESHRVRIKELENSVETKNESFVWCGARICQKRSGSTVVRNYFEQGFEEGTTDYFYTRDHLGSVREVLGSDGTTIASRVSYDPWGKITESGSGAVTDFAFTGHHFDRPTALGLTWYRGYDPSLGRWLSRDPIGLQGGLNLYTYVNNDPFNLIDPTGQGTALYNRFEWRCKDSRPCPPPPIASPPHAEPANRCGGGGGGGGFGGPPPSDRNSECCMTKCMEEDRACLGAPMTDDAWKERCGCRCIARCGCTPLNFSCQ